jgi:hypothetical protein
VVGDLTRHFGREFIIGRFSLESLCYGPMHGDSLRREKLGVRSLSQQRVAKRIGSRRSRVCGNEDPLVDRLPETGEDHILSIREDSLKQPMVDPST